MKARLVWLVVVGWLAVVPGWTAEAASPWRAGDVVAFVGGEDVVAAQRSGYLETLLTRQTTGQKVRFRNLGWEGDTVEQQRRDLNYPALPRQLERCGATVVVAQFGQTESLRGPGALKEFIAAYEKLLNGLGQSNRQMVLVSPTPFEPATGLSVETVAARNATLEEYVTAIRELARRRAAGVVDLFTPLRAKAGGRAPLTRDGLHLTTSGQWLAARETVRQLGFKDDLDTPPDRHTGALPDERLEALRRAIVQKNGWWFDYTRPQNWAFLGGDRTSQPSSRDHRDPKVRWFPTEMEKFVPLIEAKESEIVGLAEGLK